MAVILEYIRYSRIPRHVNSQVHLRAGSGINNFLFPNFMLLRETVGKFIAGTIDSQTRILFYTF